MYITFKKGYNFLTFQQRTGPYPDLSESDEGGGEALVK